jgi:hypothetical protein
MSKKLKIAFSGSVVLTPAYPNDSRPIRGPLTAVMPGGRRSRKSKLLNDRIKAQFAFVKFDYRHLAVESPNDRDADYKHIENYKVTSALCFLEREQLELETQALENELTFDKITPVDYPNKSSYGTKYIARWDDFAKEGKAQLKKIDDKHDLVKVTLPGGYVTGEFIEEPIARINFDYGEHPQTCSYAQQIAVTLTFPDDTPSVTLLSSAEPRRLTFKWYGASEISILIGNGTLASIWNLLTNVFVGQDHEGDFDLDFEVLYDVVECGTYKDKLPLPLIKSSEILRVPCIASMIGSSEVAEDSSSILVDGGAGGMPDAPPKQQAEKPVPNRRREPGQSRRGSRGNHD